MSNSLSADTASDFSLILGGPLYQLFRHARLTDDSLTMLRRRVIFIALFAWLPLLLLSAISGHALGHRSDIPFLSDIEAHVRFLIALPVLIAAEVQVHRRLAPAVRQFTERHLISAEDMPKFVHAVQSTMRLRNSVIVEIALLVVVYTLGLWVWRDQVALGMPTWYSSGAGGHFTLAGYWYVFVSVPILQFVLLRWYFRIFLWFMLLWRVSKLDLQLAPTHPDRAAGLGFLGASSYAFAPVLVGQGAMLSGLIASQIFDAGKSLLAFKVQILAFVAFFMVAMLLPLTVFAPRLARTKREGLANFSRLAYRYARGFEGKWFRGDAPPDDELMGTGDIQSLADLGNSFGVVQEMRLVPFGLKDIGQLAFATVLPVLPLLLTVFSLQDLADKIIRVIL